MKIGVCAIIRNCDPRYILEWLDWHVDMGVDYFFIYDNESLIPISFTVRNYQNVFVKKISGNVQQLNAYNDCLSQQENGAVKCDWIAFIDDDEFIVVEQGTLKELLTGQKNSGLALNWVTFGAGEAVEGDCQIERYTRSTPLSNPINKHVKTIVRPETVRRFGNPHFPIYEKGNSVDVFGNRVKGPFTQTPVAKKAWINHYYCKTEKEFTAKVARGRADMEGSQQMQTFYDTNNAATEINTKAIEIKHKKMIPLMRPAGLPITELERLVTHISVNLRPEKSTMIEIGSFAGESTVLFAKYFKKVFAIDPFKSYPVKDARDFVSLYTDEQLEKVYQQFFAKTVFYTNIVHIREKSDDAVMLIPEPVGFVYIDGLHTYDQCKQDILNYLTLISDDGYIGGHDYVRGFSGVMKAVDEVLGEPDIVFKDGSWLKRKRNVK